jgi:tungstate transport system ATP-binding protein
MTPLFEVRNLKHVYKGRTVLEEERLDLYPETITGIAGPNGSGKSTLINILGLIIKPSQGTLRFLGDPVGPFSAKARGKIATLPQEPVLLKRRVRDNVAYGLLAGKDTDNLDKRVYEALEAVGLSPASFAGRSAGALSGGEVRRVALAARLALKPRFLLLDEPTAHVDDHSCAMVRQAVLKARQQWKTTFLIASHDREWLESISDQTLTAFNGCLYKEERVNILSGPWKQNGEFWIRVCESPDHEGIPVPRPPDLDQSTAILPASALRIMKDKCGIPGARPWFRAEITGMTLSRSREHLFLFLSSGDSRLVCQVPPADAGSLSPGQSVYACYDPSRLSFR